MKIPMKTSDGGINAIMQREGVRQKAYPDVKGIWTIGVGHTGPHVCEGLAWTMQQVHDALADDLRIAENCINSKVTTQLTINQFDALVSFVFNVGVSAFSNSTMLKILNEGNIKLAGGQFDIWHIPVSIIGRRNSERDQFFMS